MSTVPYSRHSHCFGIFASAPSAADGLSGSPRGLSGRWFPRLASAGSDTVRILRSAGTSICCNGQRTGSAGVLPTFSGARRRLGERNLPDERFVQRSDVIHADLPRYGLGTDGTGSAGPALSCRPVHASVRPCSDSGRGSCGEWAAMAGRRRPSPEASAGEWQGRGVVTGGERYRSGNSAGESRAGGWVRRHRPNSPDIG